MKRNSTIALLWIVRIPLGILTAFWVFLIPKLAYLRCVGGPASVRSYLLHIGSVTPPFTDSTPNPVNEIETIYQGLLILLSITWVLREVSRLLRRRVTDQMKTSAPSSE